MASSQPLSISTASTIVGRIRFLPAAAGAVRLSLAPLLDEAFFAGAPFDHVLALVHLSGRQSEEPRHGFRIRRGGELTLTVETSFERLRAIRERPAFERALRRVLLDALLEVAERYGRPRARLLAAREEA